MKEIKEIINKGTIEEKKALFRFNINDDNTKVLLKFNLWARYFCHQYFETDDAPFHEDINTFNLKAYRGELDQFVNIAFRGAGKDVKTKLFITYCILNDIDVTKRYYKILTHDLNNAKQIVTDIYNILVNPRVVEMYSDTFSKTVFKREETMTSFTTNNGIKVIADTVGVDQRGAIQEEARPDFIWFNDFENRVTLRSALKTKTIWDNMEEARTSLQKGGVCLYTCNYISEMGNVHKLVTEKLNDKKMVLIVPILEPSGLPAWKRYSIQDIELMKRSDDDFEGERMCKPSANRDVIFDRDTLDIMPVIMPKRIVGGLKIYRDYDPSHRYAGGHDVAGGVGLDSSTSVIIDFSVFPAQVVATYADNNIKPEPFGDAIYQHCNIFGGCISAPENNKFDQAILKAKLLGADIFINKGSSLNVKTNNKMTYGWNTNSLTKPKMFFDVSKAISDGILLLNDRDLINEAKSYSRNNLIDKEIDPRLTTRHFDLLTALAIAWQMKDYAVIKVKEEFPIIWNNEETQTNPGL